MVVNFVKILSNFLLITKINKQIDSAIFYYNKSIK